MNEMKQNDCETCTKSKKESNFKSDIVQFTLDHQNGHFSTQNQLTITQKALIQVTFNGAWFLWYQSFLT